MFVYYLFRYSFKYLFVKVNIYKLNYNLYVEFNLNIIDLNKINLNILTHTQFQ